MAVKISCIRPRTDTNQHVLTWGDVDEGSGRTAATVPKWFFLPCPGDDQTGSDLSIFEPTILLLLLGAFFAAFAVGAAGFGDALIAAAFWLQFMAPGEAVPLIVLAGLAIHGLPFLRLWRSLDYSKLLPFLIAGAFCVPIGALLLKVMPAEPFRLTIGALLIAYSLFRLAVKRLPDIARGGTAADAAIGAVGGVLGGLAGLSGVVVTVWCNLRGWSKEQQRGVFQPFILSMHAMALLWLAIGGHVTAATGWNFLLILPAIVLGSIAGILVYGRLDERRFTQAILILLLASGVMLLI